MNPVNQTSSNAVSFDAPHPQVESAFRCMPDELIQKIAHMVDGSKLNFQLSCKKVFKCFNTSVHRATWKFGFEKSFEYFSSKHFPNIRELIVQCRFVKEFKSIENLPPIKNIQKIDFGKSAWSDTLIHSLLPHSELQYLSLDYCSSISTAAWRNVMIFLEQLVVLELCMPNFSGMEDVTFKNLLNLEILKLDQAVSLSDQVLGNILAATPKLRELSILNFQPKSDLAFEHMASTKIATLKLGNDDRYRSLDLTIDVESFSIREVNLIFFRKLFEKNSNLTALNLHRTIIKRDMPELEPCPLSKIENLKSLELNYCRLKYMLGLSRNFSLLESLKLNRCEDVETFIKEEKINPINLKLYQYQNCKI